MNSPLKLYTPIKEVIGRVKPRLPGKRKYYPQHLKPHQLATSKVSNASLENLQQKCSDVSDEIFGERSAPMAFRDANLVRTFARPPWPGALHESHWRRRDSIEKVARMLVKQGVMRDEHANFNQFMEQNRLNRGKDRKTRAQVTQARKKFKTPEWLAAHPNVKYTD